MAKEYHYCKKCGKESVVVATNRAEAIRKRKWFAEKYPICNECTYAEAVEMDKVATASLELPDLIGTEAQVTLATLVRLDRVVQMMRVAGDEFEPTFLTSKRGAFTAYPHKTLDAVLREVGAIRFEIALAHLYSIESAAWWLDNQSVPPAKLVTDALDQIDEAARPENNPALIEAVNAEATIRPLDPVTETIAVFWISSKQNLVGVRFDEKHDGFREQIKLFNFKWNDVQKRWDISTNPDQYVAIAAEVGAHLIANGFVVRILDNDVRQAILDGNITKSEGRRIDWFGNEKFRIDWRRIDGDFYDDVKKLKGAVWSKPDQTVLVPLTSADDVRDFAETFGFKLTDAATKAADSFDEYRRNGMIAAGSKRSKGSATAKQLGRDNVGTVHSSLLDS